MRQRATLALHEAADPERERKNEAWPLLPLRKEQHEIVRDVAGNRITNSPACEEDATLLCDEVDDGPLASCRVTAPLPGGLIITRHATVVCVVLCQ